MSNDIEKLRQAVERVYGCPATHARSEFVTDVFNGEIVWRGMVGLFAISGRDCHRAYAWCYPKGDEIRYMTVLDKPPVTNALSAVPAAIASDEMK